MEITQREKNRALKCWFFSVTHSSVEIYSLLQRGNLGHRGRAHYLLSEITCNIQFPPQTAVRIKGNIHCTIFFYETGTGYSCVFINSWPFWPHKEVLLTKVHKQNKPLHFLLCLAVTSLTQSYFHFVIDVRHELFNTTYLGTGISCKITTKCKEQSDSLFAFIIEKAQTVNIFYIWSSQI